MRISIAKITAMRKKTSAVPMYIRPIFLWSVVVSQAPMPSRRATCVTASGATSGAGTRLAGRPAQRRRAGGRLSLT